MKTPSNVKFERRYESHLKHLRLKGLQPKTIEVSLVIIRPPGLLSEILQ